MRVRPKLALLAGFPVLGALLLSMLIANDARQRARAAATIGTVDDLAQLTDRMSLVVHRLRVERAQTAFDTGIGNKDSAQLAQNNAATDAALASLTNFLAARDESKLPPKLAHDLSRAREKLALLHQFRAHVQQPEFPVNEYLEFCAEVTDSLIGATAALMQLSSDGDLLRSISQLVATMQVIERSSREHALLSYVFGQSEFPPGTFRSFLTLVTEQQVYAASLANSATDADVERLQNILRGTSSAKVNAMRKTALETVDEHLSVDATDWFTTQQANIESLRAIEQETANRVREAASKKIAETRQAVRLGVGLAATVVLISSLLGWAITRGLTRSVLALTEATEAVEKNGDFGIRAIKTSRDELGQLTDAFNRMLTGIQERDIELRIHREDLEALVEARTRQLTDRNDQMRLVLDNVAQGLAMIDAQGLLLPEYSRAFANWFGTPDAGTPFASALAGRGDELSRDSIEQAYAQLVEDILPLALSLDQMPKRLQREEHHFALSFQPVMRADKIDRTLLVVQDITAELVAQRVEATQREKIKVFEHVMRDRAGFLEFVKEARDLVERIRADVFHDAVEEARAVHTLKGICAVFDVKSVAEAAHALEQAVVEGDDERAREANTLLVSKWDEFARQVVPVLGDDRVVRVEMTRSELEGVIAAIRAEKDHGFLERVLTRFRHEPALLRFKRIEEQFKGLALRLGKPEPSVRIEAGDVRIPVPPYREFWSTFAHVIRNTVDHGMEMEEDRIRLGKPRQNVIELRAASDAQGLTIEIADDGRGIDWDKLREIARTRGLAHQSHGELVQAIFTDGISTAREVTENSGRGVGMAALLQACTALGGEIQVESEMGRGTRLRFVFPPVEHIRSTSAPSPPFAQVFSAPPPVRQGSRPSPSEDALTDAKMAAARTAKSPQS